MNRKIAELIVVAALRVCGAAVAIRWVKGWRAAGSKFPLVRVRMALLDHLWRGSPMYLAPGDQGIGNRAEKLRVYLGAGPGPHELDAPEGVFGDGSVGFIDGRHRVSVLRDLGVREIAVAVPPENVQEFLKATQGKLVSGNSVTLSWRPSVSCRSGASRIEP